MKRKYLTQEELLVAQAAGVEDIMTANVHNWHKVRRLSELGFTIKYISFITELHDSSVRRLLHRDEPEQQDPYILARNKKGAHIHNLFKPWKRPEPKTVGGLRPCQAWHVVDGKAVQCGKMTKGQYCEEHRHVTRTAVVGHGGASSRMFDGKR